MVVLLLVARLFTCGAGCWRKKMNIDYFLEVFFGLIRLNRGRRELLDSRTQSGHTCSNVCDFVSRCRFSYLKEGYVCICRTNEARIVVKFKLHPTGPPSCGLPDTAGGFVPEVIYVSKCLCVHQMIRNRKKKTKKKNESK